MSDNIKKIEQCIDKFVLESKAEEWTPNVRKLVKEILILVQVNHNDE